ncbi:MAG: DUF1499 domain-containing protein [Pseudomonadota bacterium]
MLKLTFYLVIGLVLLICLTFAAMSVLSRQQTPPSLVDGKLSACPATPNCVCSEDPRADAHIEPLRFTQTPDAAWQTLKQIITQSGGRIEVEQNGYLRAIYVSRIFRFIDDVEFRLDPANQVIQVRSAARSGRSDLGVNRARVEHLRALLRQTA